MSRGGEEATTKEFLTYGPIKASELCRRNNLSFDGEDYDCFFMDTEGSGNLYHMTKNLYHGIFSLESIATCILFISKEAIGENETLYISRHIQISILFNSSSKNDIYPGLAVIGRDIGLDTYDAFEKVQEIKRVEQDKKKRDELEKKLNINTNINFSVQNLKYIAEPPLDIPKLYLSSLKDLFKFIINNSKSQVSQNPNHIIKQFNKNQEIINTYPDLLKTDKPMEETFKNVFSIELQRINNNIINEFEVSIKNYIDTLGYKIFITDEIKENKLLEIERRYETMVNSSFPGIKTIMESLYDAYLLKSKNHFEKFIYKLIDEKKKYYKNDFIPTELQKINDDIITEFEIVINKFINKLGYKIFITDGIEEKLLLEVEKNYEKMVDENLPDIKTIMESLYNNYLSKLKEHFYLFISKLIYTKKTDYCKKFMIANTIVVGGICLKDPNLIINMIKEFINNNNIY
ncbi:hypothetical protein PIROE2DRAFT_62365 [Piromyces sp. E2]|nr:hypothetical protein PIROE2DRAFT_62365 [Piromyces sp. E2]|eukprot:OUM61643.1 hypothetical protein PIROE2DRAFT_62365 [Piromyces sp. E2]